MRAVWKYPLYPGTPCSIPMPIDAIVRYVGDQGGVPTLWAEVDTNAHYEDREFFVFGTGHPITEEGLMHIGTSIGDPFVWHIYERIKEK